VHQYPRWPAHPLPSFRVNLKVTRGRWWARCCADKLGLRDTSNFNPGSKESERWRLPPSVVRSPETIVQQTTPPGHPESEDDDFIPSVSHADCKIIDEVGPSFEEEAPPPPPAVAGPSVRVMGIRNKKTNTTRYAELDQLFRPGPQDRIILHKLKLFFLSIHLICPA
jgi:hypothetical protein